jgi:hypothetical protein
MQMVFEDGGGFSVSVSYLYDNYVAAIARIAELEATEPLPEPPVKRVVAIGRGDTVTAHTFGNSDAKGVR